MNEQTETSGLTVTAEDLAAKHNKQSEEFLSARAGIKATERNGKCPCGCGKKAKKCVRGQQVLAFKRMLRGNSTIEVLLGILILALAWKAMIGGMARDTNQTLIIERRVYIDTSFSDDGDYARSSDTLQHKP